MKILYIRFYCAQVNAHNAKQSSMHSDKQDQSTIISIVV